MAHFSEPGAPGVLKVGGFLTRSGFCGPPAAVRVANDCPTAPEDGSLLGPASTFGCAIAALIFLATSDLFGALATGSATVDFFRESRHMPPPELAPTIGFGGGEVVSARALPLSGLPAVVGR